MDFHWGEQTASTKSLTKEEEHEKAEEFCEMSSAIEERSREKNSLAGRVVPYAYGIKSKYAMKRKTST